MAAREDALQLRPAAPIHGLISTLLDSNYVILFTTYTQSLRSRDLWGINTGHRVSPVASAAPTGRWRRG